MVLVAEQKPVMKWAGNKMGTPVIERVKELYEPFRDSCLWYEPFVGIGGALLAIDPKKAVCFDASHEVIGLHRWIRDGGTIIDFPHSFTEKDYYAQRSRFWEMQSEYWASPDLVDSNHFFSLMIWLNKACYNGLWRVNQRGFFNTPIGKSGKGTLNSFSAPSLPVYRDEWYFFKNCNREYVEREAFVYVDPPYWGTHSAYTAKNFTWNDQVELAKWLASLASPIVASNSNEPEIINLYNSLGFEIELIEVRRSINCKGGDRAPAIEMLAYKNCGAPQ